jgi:hypothetical protein
VRTLAIALSVIGCGAGCGGSGSAASSGTLTITGSGQITASSASVTASTNESVALDDGALPSGLSLTFSGGGRVVSADLSALVSALGGQPLAMLSAGDLDANQVLTASGTLAYTGASVQNLPVTYVVQSYTPTASAFLTLDLSASSAGTSAFGTLAFTHD